MDHLNWANKVSSYLFDDHAAELNVQLDDHKCAFGEWLYGEGRKESENIVPELLPLLSAIEQPHRRLHESARHIQEVFRRADPSVGAMLRQAKADHLVWMKKVQDTLLTPTSEESAAASEELVSQTNVMSNVVQELTQLVKGKSYQR